MRLWSLLARLSSLDHILTHCEISHSTTQDSTPWPSPLLDSDQSASTSSTLCEDDNSRKLDAGRKTCRFRSRLAEIGFCLSMFLTQLVGEYLISGFSVLWTSLGDDFGDKDDFLPAALLSLIQCSTILVFARLSDKYGGYPVFMFGVIWLAIWSTAAGLATSLATLELCRAMQGLAIAAYTPSCMTLFGIMPEGRRRNITLGTYGACAPLGFFLGIFISAALPKNQWPWYFWTAAVMAVASALLAYLTVPMTQSDVFSMSNLHGVAMLRCDSLLDQQNQVQLDAEQNNPTNKAGPTVSAATSVSNVDALSGATADIQPTLGMDWLGSAAISSCLILLVYSLNAGASDAELWKSAQVLAPFLIGVFCLGLAVYVEGWVATSPLVPRAFFKPRSVTALITACIFFYGSFGVWLFTATEYFEARYGVTGLQVALWFLPMAAGGIIIAIVGSAVLHVVPISVLLVVSGLAWIGAPLLLALDTATGYWPFPFPANLCATLGVDLTYTVSILYLSSTQPQHLQGLTGAICSLMVNLGISVALSLAEIKAIRSSHKTSFWFAMGCAGIGFIIVVLFVRISKSKIDGADANNAHADEAGTGDGLELSNTPTRPASSASEKTTIGGVPEFASRYAPWLTARTEDEQAWQSRVQTRLEEHVFDVRPR